MVKKMESQLVEAEGCEVLSVPLSAAAAYRTEKWAKSTSRTLITNFPIFLTTPECTCLHHAALLLCLQDPTPPSLSFYTTPTSILLPCLTHTQEKNYNLI